MRLPLLPSGAALKITQAEGIVGGTLWPAAAALCDHLLEQHNKPQDRPPHPKNHDNHPHCNVIELGSGTGAVGMFAAATFDDWRVTLTEHKPPLEAVIPFVPFRPDGSLDDDTCSTTPQKSNRLLNLIQENVHQNQQVFRHHNTTPRVMELDWTHPAHAERVLAASSTNKDGFDLVLASDVTYHSALHECLAQTMARLLLRRRRGGRDATCLVAHQERVLNLRGQDFQRIRFESAARQAGLHLVRQHDRVVHDKDTGKGHKVCILELRHHSRPDEQSW